MIGGTKIVLNGKGMGAMLKSKGLRKHLTSLMQGALTAARNDRHDDTGAYERGLHIRQDTTDRVAVRLVAGDPKGVILEANYGILARALDSLGLGGGDADPGKKLVQYTTKDGRTRTATQAQVDNWTRGKR